MWVECAIPFLISGCPHYVQAMHNSEEAHLQQRQEQRTKGFAPKPLPPGSRYSNSQYGYSEDSADFRNNAPQASVSKMGSRWVVGAGCNNMQQAGWCMGG